MTGSDNTPAPGPELLTCAEMAAAEARSGVPTERLMESAGGAVADAIVRRFPCQPVNVLCGPGNNGGDGFVVARILAARGWPARVSLLGERGRLRGDADLNAGRWKGAIGAIDPANLGSEKLVVDALFGTGLARPLEGAARAMVLRLNAEKRDVVAIDVPSGVSGDGGQILGQDAAAPRCALTITFFRRKPCHVLLPGRALAGEVECAEIGIPAGVLAAIRPRSFVNDPALWRAHFRWPRLEGHKYDRGHALIAGGRETTGAARLAARGAMRVGAGLVTLAAPASALPLYAQDRACVLTLACEDADTLALILEDARKNAVLLGPGLGLGVRTRAMATRALAAGKACVLDADALTSFESFADDFIAALRPPCVLTPHEGEFRRLFPDILGDKLARARQAAQRTGAVVLLKGADSVIAAPDGRAAVNVNAPADLATAGAGDVLAGLCVGLIAQGMPAFEAACAACWLHGEAAAAFGPGLIADDLPEMIPQVLAQLRSMGA